MTWPGLESWSGVGTAVCRVVLGLVMMVQGWGNVAGGARQWASIGYSALAPLGLQNVADTAYGATASFVQFFGGFLVVVGFATRPVSFLVALVLAISTVPYLTPARIGAALDPIAVMAAFVLLVFVGPGSLSVDARLTR